MHKKQQQILRGEDIYKKDASIITRSEAPKDEFYQLAVANFKQKPKLIGQTAGQQDYLDTINQSVITICTGPAGTGKTWISTVRALELFQEGKFKRIIFTRPAVECEDRMGFIPGEIDEKFAPYILPITDILEEFLSQKQIDDYVTKDIIRFTPLAYMRGHSIKDSIVVLDEAQNCSYGQLLMFITRIGSESKFIINGDQKQTDRSDGAYRNFVTKMSYGFPIDGVNVVNLTEKDIVRHWLIREILEKLGE